MTDTQITNMKNNLLTMAPRPFGESFGEQLFFRIMPELTDRKDASHDATLNQFRTEIKLSRVVNKRKTKNLFESILDENTTTFLDSSSEEKFDCNIQQVKPKCFDVIIYGIMFDDVMHIFKTTSDVIENDKNIGYVDKQHRGNVGEGQFHIKQNNIQYHLDNFLIRTLTWDDLVTIVKGEDDQDN